MSFWSGSGGWPGSLTGRQLGRTEFVPIEEEKAHSPGIRLDVKGRYWVVAHVGGRKIEKLIGNKTAAKKFLTREREKERRSRLFPEEVVATDRRSGLQLTVQDLCRRYRQEDENINTKSDTHERLEEVWVEILGEHCTAGEVSIETITTQQAAWLAQGLAAGTINRYCARLRRVLSQATRDRVIPYNPIAGYPSLKEAPARNRRLEFKEEDRLKPLFEPWSWEYVDFALLSGFRQEEQFKSRCDWVSLDRNEIRIPRTKNQESRTIPMRPRLRAIVERRLEISKAGFLFENYSQTNYMRPNNFLRRIFKPALEAAQIEGLWWHDLRRTCATRLAMDGVPLPVIQEYLGHANSSTTDRYLSMAGSHLHKYFDDLE